MTDPAVSRLISQTLVDDDRSVPANVQVPQEVPVFTPEVISTVIKQLSRAAPGVTGWHATHLQVIIQTQDGLRALTLLLNWIFEMRLPAVLLNQLSVSTLLPLVKPNGGIRPILIGDTLIRAIGKAVSYIEQPAISRVLNPLQLAVGVKGGVDIAVHGIRNFLDTNPDACVLSVDIKNAFGSLTRASIANALSRLPAEDSVYSRWFFHAFYARESMYLDGSGAVSFFNTGVPQGGPTSMAWFCLTLHPVLEQVSRFLKPRGGTILAYADDIFLLGRPNDLLSALNLLGVEANHIGLSVQPAKCKMVPARTSNLDAVAQLVAQDPRGLQVSPAASILGSMVGEALAEIELASEVDIAIPYPRLEWIDDLQCQLILLRQCIITRFQHYARTLSPDVSKPLLHEVVIRTRAILASMLGKADISDALWQEASLPFTHGGLGLPDLENGRFRAFYAPATHAGSFWMRIADKPLLDNWTSPQSRCGDDLAMALEQCQAMLKEFFDKPIKPTPTSTANPEKLLPDVKLVSLPSDLGKLLSNPSPEVFKLQHSLAQLAARVQFRRLWRSIPVDDPHRIQILANTSGTPQLVFKVLPTEPALILSNNEVTYILSQYLSQSLEPVLGLPSSPIRCTCSSQFTKSNQLCTSEHLFNCRKQGAFTVRHTALMDVVRKAFKSAGITPEIEKLVQSIPNQGGRGNQVPLKRFDVVGPSTDSYTKIICTDVSVVSHRAKEHLKNALCKPYANADHGVATKLRKYMPEIQRDTEVFRPLVCETSGAIHRAYYELYHHLGLRVNNVAPLGASWAAPDFTAYYMQLTSVVLWRETSRSLKRIAVASVRQQRPHDVAPAEEEDLAEDPDA